MPHEVKLPSKVMARLPIMKAWGCCEHACQTDSSKDRLKPRVHPSVETPGVLFSHTAAPMSQPSYSCFLRTGDFQVNRELALCSS